MQLVIAEKPSVARDLARVLGANRKGDGCLEGAQHVVTWCVGHLLELEEPGAYKPVAEAARSRAGLQVVALHTDAVSGAVVPVPLDGSNLVPLEFAATEAPTGALPDVVR